MDWENQFGIPLQVHQFDWVIQLRKIHVCSPVEQQQKVALCLGFRLIQKHLEGCRSLLRVVASDRISSEMHINPEEKERNLQQWQVQTLKARLNNLWSLVSNQFYAAYQEYSRWED